MILEFVNQQAWVVMWRGSNSPGDLEDASRVAQWERDGPITHRSEDRNLSLLMSTFFFLVVVCASSVPIAQLWRRPGAHCTEAPPPSFGLCAWGITIDSLTPACSTLEPTLPSPRLCCNQRGVV
jgi:hypothetical protein